MSKDLDSLNQGRIYEELMQQLDPLTDEKIITLVSKYPNTDFLPYVLQNTIDCSNREISIHHLADFIGAHQTINKLNLSNCEVTSLNLYYFTHNESAALKNLTHLNLSSNPIGSLGIMEFSRYCLHNPIEVQQITYLNFQNCKIDDPGYKEFICRGATIFLNLSELIFSGNRIKKVAYTHEYSNNLLSKLTILDLSNNMISEEEMTKFEQFITAQNYQLKLKSPISTESNYSVMNNAESFHYKKTSNTSIFDNDYGDDTSLYGTESDNNFFPEYFH